MFRKIPLICFVLAFPFFGSTGPAYTIPSDNEFVDPSFLLANTSSPIAAGARQTIVEWADYLNTQGPWSVMNKSVTPPTGNKHDYMSWAPYSWPDCSNVGNKTELTPEQIWVQCPYVIRDGQFNPDRLLVNDTGNFNAMADAVFYNAIAWVLTGTPSYSANAAGYINTWFIDPQTYMTPNLNYAQMNRGPTGQTGTHTGLLDLKCMAKISTAILLFRKASSPHWTSNLDTAMVNWTKTYIGWMESSPIAQAEHTADNNHGTFFYNQLAANQLIVGDRAGATTSIKEYFSKQYLAQIEATGEQPLEAVRTHPYHYRAYNIAAMITNARIGNYLSLSFWSAPTSQNGTIQKACDFAMTKTPNLAEGDGPADELYSSIATVAVHYGDPGGSYANFLAQGNPAYAEMPWYLWNLPPGSSGPPPLTTANHNEAASWRVARGAPAGWVGVIILWMVSALF